MPFISFYQLNDSLAFFLIFLFFYILEILIRNLLYLFSATWLERNERLIFSPLLANFTGWIIPGGLSVFVVLRHHASFCWSCFIAVFFLLSSTAIYYFSYVGVGDLSPRKTRKLLLSSTLTLKNEWLNENVEKHTTMWMTPWKRLIYIWTLYLNIMLIKRLLIHF